MGENWTIRRGRSPIVEPVYAYPEEDAERGRRLRDLRVSLGLSIEDASRLLDVDEFGLGMIEVGRMRCDEQEVVDAYARAKGDGHG